MAIITTPKRLTHSRGKSSILSYLKVVCLCMFFFMVGLNLNHISNWSERNADYDDKIVLTDLIINGKDKGNNDNNNRDVDDNKKNDFKLAYDQSFGFFDDISSDHWRIYQQIVSEYIPHKNPADPREFVPGHSVRKQSWFNSPRAFYQTNYEPNFSCAFERRIGGNGNGDGPKWVCDPHRLKRISQQRKLQNKGGCLVYSIGSNGDYQFESGLQTMLGSPDICEIHIFDFGDFEEKMPKGLNLHYHRWGIEQGNDNGRENISVEDIEKGKQFYSLAETVKLLGHDSRDTIDIFKIDCEKCEWRTWKNWFGPSMPMLQQILVETHATPKDYVLPFFNGIMDNGYVMFHKEPNIQFAGGDAMEFAFLKLNNAFFPKDNNNNIDDGNQ